LLLEPEKRLPRRAWVEVDLSAIRGNITAVRAHAGEAGILAVVKADRVKLGPAGGGGLAARVEAAVFTGPTLHYTLSTLAGTRLIAVASSAEDGAFAPGQLVTARWSPSDCLVIA